MSRRSPPSLVKELRDRTGAGMMDCKRALEETGGDLEAARSAAPRAGHGAGRQARRPRDDRGRGRLASIDDDARHDRRGRLRDRAGLEERGVPGVRAEGARRASTTTAPDAARRARGASASSWSPSSARTSSSRGAARSRRGDGEMLGAYVHPPANKIGVLVKLARRRRRARAQARDAHRVRRAEWRRRATSARPTSSRPSARSTRTPTSVQAKPEQAREKIVEGMLDEAVLRASGVLTEQPWIHDTAQTVGQALEEAGLRGRSSSSRCRR